MREVPRVDTFLRVEQVEDLVDLKVVVEDEVVGGD
jgi:hypothetical protein